MKLKITVLLFVLLNAYPVFPDTIDYWSIRQENKLKLTANLVAFDSVKSINIYRKDLNERFIVSYNIDAPFDTGKKLIFRKGNRTYCSLYFKKEDVNTPMMFRIKEILKSELNQNDTLHIYYSQLGSKYSKRDSVFIGSFVIKEPLIPTVGLKKVPLTHDYKFYRRLGLFLFIAAGITIFLVRSKRQ